MPKPPDAVIKWAAIVLSAISLMGGAYAYGVSRAADNAVLAEKVANHERRLSAVEQNTTSLPGMAADIAWIKATLRDMQQSQAKNRP